MPKPRRPMTRRRPAYRTVKRAKVNADTANPARSGLRGRRLGMRPRSGRLVRAVRNALLVWKSQRSTFNFAHSLSGVLTAPIGNIYRLSEIHQYDPQSTVAQAQDISQARMTNNLILDRLVAKFTFKHSHNRNLAVRFFCFRNRSWYEPLSYVDSGSPSYSLITLSNLFQDHVDRANLAYTTPAASLAMGNTFNRALCKSKRDKFMDRTVILRGINYSYDFSAPTGSAPDSYPADGTVGQDLRNYHFSIPLKFLMQYEQAPVDSSEHLQSKSGELFFGFIVGVDDPAQTSNDGNFGGTVDFSVVYRERS